MEKYKQVIFDKICYTELVYGRIAKKLTMELVKANIESLIATTIYETDVKYFQKKGKNIYITNHKKNIRLTINSYTNRIITADVLDKIEAKRKE
jgi:hypothetical protein